MKAAAAFLAIALAGCFPNRSQEFACSVTTDCDSGRVCDQGFCVLGGRGNPDANTDCMNFQSPHVMGCAIPEPGPALELSIAGTYVYDTDAATLLDPNNTPVTPPPNALTASGEQLISIQALSVDAGVTLRAIGSHPLVVASWSTITITGEVDVSSQLPPAGATNARLLTGAGSNPATCHAATRGKDNMSGAGGSGGGGFAGAGGDGGDGNSDNASNGVGGAAVASTPLIAAGCSGAAGGDAQQAGGVGGAGGGAIQLVAKTSISIALTGILHAGGAGGGAAIRTGGNDQGGGGGGGSGGMIGLDAPSVDVAAGAILAANGGGGGGGTNGNPPVNPGGDATASATAAAGGTTNGQGVGGDGSFATTLAGEAGTDSDDKGGGGGGGGAGFVVVHSSGMTLSPSAIQSPAVTMMP